MKSWPKSMLFENSNLKMKPSHVELFNFSTWLINCFWLFALQVISKSWDFKLSSYLKVCHSDLVVHWWGYPCLCGFLNHPLWTLGIYLGEGKLFLGMCLQIRQLRLPMVSHASRCQIVIARCFSILLPMKLNPSI